ncbi:bifunctional polysaccharide deacetylase/glycosyltransferase family 2 protein [Actinopolymorpha sp. NPDC004070]|uniref:bifunctional polysaccharide deacetylase/glycosyltransferase family 2 protein n=1 Tax=Actinopolymorpha sp. NPDC004070 TaxID=3154548 RepID=UPI0033B1C1A6
MLSYEAGDKVAQKAHALDVLIPRLKAAGYRFVTVSKAMGTEGLDHPPTTAGLWKGRAFVTAVQLSQAVVRGLFVLLAVTGILVLLRLAMMLVFARRHARVRNHPDFSWGPEVTEPVSVVVPAYNERECIANTVRSLAASSHPVEIIVVDDGSTDDTAEIVKSLGLPGVTLVRQPNSGKATALNTGIAWASYELIVMMDGDTVFEPDTVHHLVQPFADPRVGAVAGNAKVGNRDRLIGKWQHIEYVMGFNLDRRMYDLLRCMPTIPGAVGAFRRTALREAGMMTEDTLAEDTDITMALHRGGWHVVYQEHACAWTEAPGTMTQLWRQRYRWSYGTMQAIWKHRRSLIERGPSGRFGRVGLPLITVFQVLAPLVAPLVDIVAVYGLVFHNPWKTMLVWTGLLGVQALAAAYAFRLDREDLRNLWVLALQQVAYRQLMYLVLLHSSITALTGTRLRWHKLRRTGEVGAPPGPSVPASRPAA